MKKAVLVLYLWALMPIYEEVTHHHMQAGVIPWNADIATIGTIIWWLAFLFIALAPLWSIRP